MRDDGRVILCIGGLDLQTGLHRDFSIPQFAHRAVDTVCKLRWNCTASRHDHGAHLTLVYKRCRRCTTRITAATTPIRGGCAKMKIKTTDDRERLWENLCEATGEQARSKALDRAARYYLRMCGGVATYGRGDIQTLLDAAEEEIEHYSTAKEVE